jgi:hypothetical protein
MRDSIFAWFDGSPNDTIEVSSGRFEGPTFGRWFVSCRLKFHGKSGGVGGHDGVMDADMVHDNLEAAGWASDKWCDADGTDGTAFGMRRGGVFCHVIADWDGGDDSDSTYVPSPYYSITVDCLVDRKDFCHQE